VCLAEGDSVVPLVCVHGWAGRVFEWQAFADHFAGERECWGMIANEHVGRARPQTMLEMCEEYADTLLRRFPNRPLVVLGNSVGGVIAYETARCFERKGGIVQKVVFFDTYPRKIPFSQHLSAYFSDLFARPRLHFHYKGKSGLIPFIRERWKRSRTMIRKGGLPKPQPNYATASKKHRRDYYAFLAEFHPLEPCGCSFLVIQCNSSKSNYLLAWDSLLQGGGTRVFVESEHTELVCEPIVTTVAQIVRENA